MSYWLVLGVYWVVAGVYYEFALSPFSWGYLCDFRLNPFVYRAPCSPFGLAVTRKLNSAIAGKDYGYLKGSADSLW